MLGSKPSPVHFVTIIAGNRSSSLLGALVNCADKPASAKQAAELHQASNS
jgi:hypothetical protein